MVESVDTKNVWCVGVWFPCVATPDCPGHGCSAAYGCRSVARAQHWCLLRCQLTRFLGGGLIPSHRYNGKIVEGPKMRKGMQMVKIHFTGWNKYVAGVALAALCYVGACGLCQF